MGKFIFRHGGNEFHFQLGRHFVEPGDREKLNPNELDALVLEDRLGTDPMERDLVRAMRELKKPIYYVESPKLIAKHRKIHFSGPSAFVAGTFTAVASSIAAKLSEKRKNEPAQKISRAGFIAGVLTGILGFFAMPFTMHDWGRSFDQSRHAPIQNKTYSLDEMESKPMDSKGTLGFAKRNSVSAEGITELAKRHRKIGIVFGAAHYNIYRYLRDEKLRHEYMGEYYPSIRKVN